MYLRTPGLRIGLIATAIALLSGMLMAPVFARADTSVSMMDDSFSPQTITIAPGDTVTWTNNGSMNHTVTADDNSFSSGSVLPGNSFTHTFDTVGSFPYYCQFHGAAGGVGMSGVVIVSAAASSSNATSTGSTSTSTTSTDTSTSTTATSTTSNDNAATTTSATSSDQTATSTSSTSTSILLSNGSVMPSNTGATISWTTNIASDAQVSYGLSSNYTTTTSSDNASSTSHVVFIAGLSPGTLYHFRAMSTANGASGMSPDETFTTTNNGTSSATSTPGTGGTGTTTATSTPGSTGGGTGTTTGTTTPPSTIDLPYISSQIAQLEAEIKAIEARIQAYLQGGIGNPGTPGTPPPSSSGTAVFADSYSVSPGGAITFRGQGFGTNETVNVSVDGTLIGQVQTSSNGSFAISGTASTDTGDTTYDFTGASSGRNDTVMITVETGDNSDNSE